jgi:hypothetical protein
MNLDAVEKFKLIYLQNPEVAKERGRISESDTRSNILDRLLHEVFEWPRSSVERETFINEGFIDYLVKHGRPIFVLEAKAEGETFYLPHRKIVRRKIKIKSLFSLDKPIKTALTQAQRYCVDTGTRFAVVSNGYSFIVFRAIVEGVSWLEGTGIVFYDYNDIKDNFSEFWNLLSYESVVDGSLENAFRHFVPSVRDFYRPIDSRADSDATYGRNPYASALKPFIDKFFGDIALQDTIDLLKDCYVFSKPIQYIDKDLDLILRDQIPTFARGADHINTSPENEGGGLGTYLRSRLATGECKSSVIVLMGGIGAGKSTYCRRFFRVVTPELVSSEGPATLCFLNYLGAPDDEKEVITYSWRILAEQIRHIHPEVNELDALNIVFAEELKMVRSIFKNSSELERKVSERLFSCASNDELFAERALFYFISKGKMPILVFDNVDQLKIEVQAQIFTLCQRITSRGCCFSILALREESFSTAIMQKHITAYSIHPYHLSSPRFKDLLGIRIDFAAREALAIAENESAAFENITYVEIVELFRFLRHSILGRNYNIIRLVESIAFGNMRLALRLFNSFVTSGATDIRKIINFHSQKRGYTVPFHEFTKSIMLGEFRFYKESRSPIVNMFNITRNNNSSHFTALRILKYLHAYADNTNANSGFVNLHALINDMADVFDNEEDCRITIENLITLEKQLIELDSRRTDSLEGASEIRITTSGIYYIEYLIKSFSYLDLVWHDTAFTDRAQADSFASKILLTDMQDRFSRVDSFLQYLKDQEDAELNEHNLEGESFWGPFIPGIFDQIQREKSVIKTKLRME